MDIGKEDLLRSPEDVIKPDPRSDIFIANTIEAQYNEISVYVLKSHVPVNVLKHYEVARNLYLYAHHVYSFYMVAQHRVLTTLEFAIKDCIGVEIIEDHGKRRHKGKGLAACLDYLIENQLIENADFPVWQNRKITKARSKYQYEKMQEMQEKGLDSIELNYDEINLDDPSLDNEFNYLSILAKVLPRFRNIHSHGTSMIHNQVLLDFQTVSIIINKIYGQVTDQNSTNDQEK